MNATAALGTARNQPLANPKLVTHLRIGRFVVQKGRLGMMPRRSFMTLAA
jgi:hypothetical protein